MTGRQDAPREREPVCNGCAEVYDVELIAACPRHGGTSWSAADHAADAAPCYYRCGLTYHGGLDCRTALEEALARRDTPTAADREGTS